MTIYLLDTNIASHIIKGDLPQVREHLLTLPIHAIAVSVVTQAELAYGVAKRGNPPGLAARVREFLARVAILPWTSDVAAVYGEMRAACEAKGITLAPLDMMIAAQAKALGAADLQSVVLVTRDATLARACVELGLRVENWAQA